MRRVREGPTRLKRAAKSLLFKLQKHNVILDQNGDVDFSNVKEPNVLASLKKNENLVRLTLMQADLEFEYPQKLEKMTIKADLLKLIDEEELKLRSMVEHKEHEELAKKVLTYEEYYSNYPQQETRLAFPNTSNLGASRKDTKYEEFIKEKTSANIFENDLLDQAYKFWENDVDKTERLKKIWLDLKRKNALGGVD